MKIQAPIGVFDSGLGGLTVLRALQGALPAEDFVYFADTQYLPYGNQPEALLRERALRIIARFESYGVKAIVMACNTITAASVDAVRHHTCLPVVALEPGIKPATELSKQKSIGVMATPNTLRSKRYRHLVERYAQQFELIEQACPDLAQTIELEGVNSIVVTNMLSQYLRSIAQSRADVVVLGCTHYPWVRDQISSYIQSFRLKAGHINTTPQLIDTGEAVARRLKHVLESHGLLRETPIASDHDVFKIASNAPQASNLCQTIHRLTGMEVEVEHWAI